VRAVQTPSPGQQTPSAVSHPHTQGRGRQPGAEDAHSALGDCTDAHVSADGLGSWLSRQGAAAHLSGVAGRAKASPGRMQGVREREGAGVPVWSGASYRPHGASRGCRPHGPLGESWQTWRCGQRHTRGPFRRRLRCMGGHAAPHVGRRHARPACACVPWPTRRRCVARSPLPAGIIALPPPTHRGVRTARVTETRVPPPHAHSPHPHAVPGVVAWAVSMGHVAATHLSQLWLLAGRLGGCGWCRSRCGCGEAGRVRWVRAAGARDAKRLGL